MAAEAATSGSTTEIQHSDSTNLINTFDNIRNQKLTRLLDDIKDAQRTFRATSLSVNDDDNPVADDSSVAVAAAAAAAAGADLDDSAVAAGADIDGSAVAAGAQYTFRCFRCCSCCCCQNGNGKEEGSGSGGGNGIGGSSSIANRTLHLNGKLEKLCINLTYIQKSFANLRTFEENVVKPFDTAVYGLVNEVVEKIKQPRLSDIIGNSEFDEKLAELDRLLMVMRNHIPSSRKIFNPANTQTQHSTSSNSATTGLGYGDTGTNVLNELPILPSNKQYLSNPAFTDVKNLYDSLCDFNHKLCLLCFSIFPENALVKRRILLYWWIGEGLILPFVTDEKKPDDIVDEILTELVKKGFIEPVDQKYRPVAKTFRMHSLVRSAVIVISKELKFFNFDEKDNPTTDFALSRRACLFGVGSSYGLTKTIVNTKTNKVDRSGSHQRDSFYQEKVNTLYNVNEQYLKLEPEWFLKSKNIKVLQLGRWMSSAENHIEVEDDEFLKMLKNMRLLMYFSLQGISRISELPDEIGYLTNLRILDLRTCHNLEILPHNVCSLKYLTHLDMSDCYLLDSVPKEISSLSSLEVLKGFVVGDPLGGGNPCTLDDLKVLKHLRKLGISTGSEKFPTSKELIAIEQFPALRNLKITWGGNSLEKSIEAEADDHTDPEKGSFAAPKPSAKKLLRTAGLGKSFIKRFNGQFSGTGTLPATLKKLDLQCYPITKRPNWLDPSHLVNLKKLYIRGGRLSVICDHPTPWTVETLCLKHLYELTMDWTDRQKSFPHLKYLEMVKCPKLTLFPSNDQGVWKK